MRFLLLPLFLTATGAYSREALSVPLFGNAVQPQWIFVMSNDLVLTRNLKYMRVET